ncbi:MAG: zinc-ribbon domain-containing protein [Anaerolineae bacterium]|nr:zinc-ribbon domain-containing protein [Anaerolineae bacterium]
MPLNSFVCPHCGMWNIGSVDICVGCNQKYGVPFTIQDSNAPAATFQQTDQQPIEKLPEVISAFSTQTCSRCGQVAIPGKRFCSKCGMLLEAKKFCAQCGSSIQPGAQFCAQCGKKL